MENLVYVLDKDGKPLMPTQRFGKVRRMLKSGEAIPVRKHPFTIQLTYESTHYKQPVVLGQDPGRTNIGLAAQSQGRCLGTFQATTRNKEVPKKMEKRRDHRKASRQGERKRRKRRAKNKVIVGKWVDIYS